jgi:hypothetical protein
MGHETAEIRACFYGDHGHAIRDTDLTRGPPSDVTVLHLEML